MAPRNHRRIGDTDFRDFPEIGISDFRNAISEIPKSGFREIPKDFPVA